MIRKYTIYSLKKSLVEDPIEKSEKGEMREAMNVNSLLDVNPKTNREAEI
jgi:hypothetical protein